MKTVIFLSALAAVSLGPSDVLATPVNNPGTPAPRHLQLKTRKLEPGQAQTLQALRLRSRAKKPKAEDVSLKAWIDRGQDIQYYSEIKIGTPAQKFDVIFDTGADDILVPGINCTTCNTNQWPHPLYDPTRSSTFNPAPDIRFPDCYGTGGTTIPFDRNNPVCTNVTVVTDKVCLDDLCWPTQEFDIANSFNGPEFTAQPFDGILGMNIENVTDYAWYWNIYRSGQLPSPVFAYYIEPREVHGSQITLGGVDKGKYKGDITSIPLSPISTNELVGGWVLQLPAIYVDGNKRVVNTTGPGAGSPAPYAEAKLDVATSFMGSPNYEYTRDLYALISPDITELDPILGIWGAPCNTINRVAKDVTFTFGAVGGPQLNLTVPKENFNAGPLPGNPLICQAIYVNLRGAREHVNWNPGWVIGAPLFKNYYTVWDGRALTFGVARPNWKKASAP